MYYKSPTEEGTMPTLPFKTRPCPVCGDVAILQLDVEGAKKYNQGAYIQDAFPNMSAADRERFISGVCGTCWSKMFPPEDEQ
jgi:hypothetical protein